MTARRLAAVLALAVLAVSCNRNDDDTTTSDSSPTSPSSATFTTRFYTGVIDSGGSRFYSFNVSVAGPVTVTLASITNANTGLPLGRPLRVGVGRPQGTGCAVASTAVVDAALVMQLAHLAPAGINCIEVADTVGLAGPIRFALRFTHP
jgi:hypothetical protein